MSLDYERLNDEERHNILCKVAHMYYNEGKTQMEIANIFETTRFKISKWLQDARTENVVEIIIHYPNTRCPSIEKQIENHYKLKQVIVLNNQDLNHQDTVTQVGKLAAEYIQRLIQPDAVLGITWGKTIHNAICQLNPDKLFPVTAVQVLGAAAKENSMVEANQIVRILAGKYNGYAKSFSAPLYMQNSKLRDQLLDEPIIKDILDLGKKADILVSGIGCRTSLPLFNPSWLPYLTEKDKQNNTAIGSIYGRMIDKNGDICDTDINEKVVGLKMAELLAIPNRVVVVTGTHKAHPIMAVLNRKLCNTLITDRSTAVMVLNQLNYNVK